MKIDYKVDRSPTGEPGKVWTYVDRMSFPSFFVGPNDWFRDHPDDTTYFLL